MQGTCKVHARNARSMQESVKTSKEHLGTSTCKEHAGNMQGTSNSAIICASKDN